MSDIKLNDSNPRVIKDQQMKRLVKSIQDFPEMTELRPIVVDENNVILGGNMRYRAMKQLGYEQTEVVKVSGLTDEQKREFIIKDNVPFGDWDWEELANGWDATELNEWGIDITTELEVDESLVADVETPGLTERAESRRGEIYQLGRHRLMCGDATNPQDVADLMNGETADIAFSSPPYNAGNTPTELAMGNKSKYKNDDDSKSQEDYRRFLDGYLQNCFDNARFTFMNIQSLSNNKRALIEVMGDNINKFADTIIWDKVHTQPAMAENVLNSRFEFIHVFSGSATRAIGTSKFRGTVDNVVQIAQQHNNEFAKIHNATFPLELATWVIKNFAKDSVMDSFGGTGTTLIACEQLGRKCFMMELDPTYCDVIRKRYQIMMTGSDNGWQEATPERK